MLKNPILQQLWIDAATFPYRSIIALQNNILDLQSNFNKSQVDLSFQIFQDDFEQIALERYAQHHISLEDIRSIMDYAWFGDSYYKNFTLLSTHKNVNYHPLPIENLIENFSKSILSHNGQHLFPSPNIDNYFFKNANSAVFDGTISCWQRLLQFVNPDLIIAAYYAFDSNINTLPVNINECRFSLPDANQFNDFRFTEQHLHQNACPSFSQEWNLYLNSLACDDMKIVQYNFHNKNIKPILLIAWLLKLCLFEYIEQSYDSTKSISKEFEINDNLISTIHSILKYFFDFDANVFNSNEYFLEPQEYSLWKILESNIISRCSHQAEILRISYYQNKNSINEYDEYIIDPLATTSRYYSYVNDITSDDVELPFLYDCLKLIQSNPHKSQYIRQCIWTYIRCQQIVYGLVVQREGCHGLNHFQHYYRQGGRFISASVKSKLSLNFYIKNIILHGKVNKIELRLSNFSNINSFFKLFTRTATEYRNLLIHENATIPNIGLTIHFLKSWGKKNVANSMPSETDGKCRYWNLLSSWWDEMSELCKAIENKPTLSFIFRSIDVASRELTVPSWPVALVYREFKNRMLIIANASLQISNDFAMPHLTAHAGEDFNTPITGLRKIYETIRFYGMLPGDRIGHAIALGLDIEDLANKTTSVLIPVWDYLEDLCWQIIFIREEGNDEMNQLRPNIELELNDLLANMRQTSLPQCIANLLTSQNILDSYIMQFPRSKNTIEQMFQIYHKLGIVEFYNKQVKLTQLFKTIDIDNLSDSEKLLFHYLFSEQVWQWEQSLGLVEISFTPNYIKQIKLFQHQMCKYVSSKEITIELCPTSNRIISGMKSYNEHPIFKLCPIENASERLSVSINSDDPLVFNTNIQNEYSQIFDAGKYKGYSSYEIMQWLREININSEKTSFCYPEASHYESIYPHVINSPTYYKDKREFIIEKLKTCIF